METVGEPFEVAFGVRCDQTQFVADDIFQRGVFALGLADQQPRKLIRHFQEILRDADVDDEHAGHQLRLHAQRRQCHAAIG